LCIPNANPRKDADAAAAHQEWFTAVELAGAPGLPGTARRVSARAAAEGWQGRERRGHAGRPAQEFHLSSLPASTRAALILKTRRLTAPPPAQGTAPAGRSEALWEGWDRKPASIKTEAQRRLDLVLEIEQLVRESCRRMDAYQAVAEQHGESVSTLRAWMRLVKGAHRGDYLPLLAPRYTGRLVYAEYDESIYQNFRDLYLNSSKPSYESCYRSVAKIARKAGLTVPSLSTLKRDLERREDPVVIVLEREGEKRAEELYPHLTRDRSVFRAMEALNADGHVLDLDTVWPDGERCRTTLIGFQDLYSGDIVGWRLAKSESAYEMGLAVLQVCDDYGVPEHLYIDNTLAMASKRMTSGAKGRKRFRDREGDPLGVLPMLGVEVHFTRVAHGQSKPIERAFRDLAESISKHPAFSGAYLGNNPMNKPHDYGTRTVTVAEVAEVAEQAIIEHRTRTGRNTRVCGRRLSFHQAFQQSYAEHSDAIRRLTPTQRRLLYLHSDVVKVRDDGCIHLFGNRYYSEDTLRLRGKQVVARYHPTERTLHDCVHVYSLSGDYIGEVPCYHAAGFADAKKAQEHNRARQQFLRSAKKTAADRRRMEAASVAAQVPPAELPPGMPQQVVRGDFGSATSIAAALPTVPSKAERTAAEDRVMANLRKIGNAVESELKSRKQVG
jgi:putative transposase